MGTVWHGHISVDAPCSRCAVNIRILQNYTPEWGQAITHWSRNAKCKLIQQGSENTSPNSPEEFVLWGLPASREAFHLFSHKLEKRDHPMCALTAWNNSAYQIYLNCIFNSIKGSRRHFSPFTFSFWKERGYPILLPEDVPQNLLLIRKVQPCHLGCYRVTGTCSGPTDQLEHRKNCKKIQEHKMSAPFFKPQCFPTEVQYLKFMFT